MEGIDFKFQYQESLNTVKPDYIIVDYYPTLDEVGTYLVYGMDIDAFISENTRSVVRIK